MVTLVLGLIFEIVFCIGFWQFWCVLAMADNGLCVLLIVSPLHCRTSGDTEELVDATAEATSDAAEEAARSAEDLLENMTEDLLQGSEEAGASTSE